MKKPAEAGLGVYDLLLKLLDMTAHKKAPDFGRGNLFRFSIRSPYLAPRRGGRAAQNSRRRVHSLDGG